MKKISKNIFRFIWKVIKILWPVVALIAGYPAGYFSSQWLMQNNNDLRMVVKFALTEDAILGIQHSFGMLTLLASIFGIGVGALLTLKLQKIKAKKKSKDTKIEA